MTDMDKALVPVGGSAPSTWATITATQPGNFSDPHTFGGQTPRDGDKLYVSPQCTTLTYDVQGPKLSGVRVANGATWKTRVDANTILHCDYFVTEMGSSYTAGDDTTPLQPGFTHQHVVADFGPLNYVTDPWAIGRGLVFMGSFKGCGDTNAAGVVPFVYTTGNVVGQSVITCLAPVTGWKVGDVLAYPGHGFRVQDDDLCTIQSISSDKLTVTVSPPFSFDHSTTSSPTFGSRPSVVANISTARLDYSSENADTIAQRGHLMLMNGNMAMLCHATLTQLGRTDKSYAITDPDGLGGGVGNPRGRYAYHQHLNGGNLHTDTPAKLNNVRCYGSPGWGFVNHGSFVVFDTCLGYKCYGATFVGENGAEIGQFVRSAAVRSTAPLSGGPVETEADGRNPATLSDFALFGSGFWTMCGGITIDSCVATGQASSGYYQNGTPFQHGGPIYFARTNLPDPSVTAMNLIPPRYVPQSLTNATSYGCGVGYTNWIIGEQHQSTPVIGQSAVSNCYLEGGVMQGYSACCDFDNVYSTNPQSTGLGVGFVHSGVNVRMNYRNCSSDGWGIGLLGITRGTGVIDHFSHRGSREGIHVTNTGDHDRSLTITNVSGPVGGTDLVLKCDGGGHSLYSPHSTNEKINDLSGWTTNQVGGQMSQPDRITLDGAQVYFPECSPNFPLDQVARKPGYLAGMTNGQLWSQFGEILGAMILPPDASQSNPRVVGLFTNGAVTYLPWEQVNHWAAAYGSNLQWTQTSPFSGHVLDSHGNQVPFGPLTLTPGWNSAPPMLVDGFMRGLWIWYDPTTPQPSNW